MATNLPSCLLTQFLEQLLKFLVNFTLLKHVKFQRNYGFLITKELIFGFQILDLKRLLLSILNPFYTKLFRTHTSHQGGGGGVIWTPYYLINTWLYKPQILQGIRDALQGLRKHKVCKKNLLYGYYGNCLITWCFSLIIVKTSTKNRYF